MLAILLLVTGTPLVAVPGFAPQEAVALRGVEEKLSTGLAERLQTASASELIPIQIVLREQVPQAELAAASSIVNKTDRRAAVVATLRAKAQATQTELLAFLDVERARGGADARIESLWIANLIGAKVSPEVVLRLAAREDVASLHYDPPRGSEVLLSAPAMQGPPTCGLNLIGAPNAWDQLGITGRGVVVGVIDTGVCSTHPDIAGQLWRNPGEIPNNLVDDDGNGFVDDVNGWNFESNNANVSDTAGHGSHVSGTVAGDGTFGTPCGVAPDARVMALKFFNSFSGEQSVWNAMQYGVANGANVLTASIGWPHSFSPNRAMWRQVCDNSIAAGVVVIYAAGNEGCFTQIDNLRTPADVPDVIAVGAVTCNDQIAGFSSCGPVSWSNVAPYNDFPFPPGLMKPDVSAPGVGTQSHNFCSAYSFLDGTSMATPHVAGLAALILEADPSLDHFGVRSILESTSLDLGPVGKDKQFGSGRVRAFDAVQAALANNNFCGAKLNSCGSFPLITATGIPSATAPSGFTVSASRTSGLQVGLLIYTDTGTNNVPFLGGNLCLSGARRAVPVQETSGTSGLCDGVLAIDMNSFRAGLLGGNPIGSLSVPGTQIHCQFWGRDSNNTFGCLLSSAFEYFVCP